MNRYLKNYHDKTNSVGQFIQITSMVMDTWNITVITPSTLNELQAIQRSILEKNLKFTILDIGNGVNNLSESYPFLIVFIIVSEE